MPTASVSTTTALKPGFLQKHAKCVAKIVVHSRFQVSGVRSLRVLEDRLFACVSQLVPPGT